MIVGDTVRKEDVVQEVEGKEIPIEFREDNVVGVKFREVKKRKHKPSGRSNRTNAIKEKDDIEAAKEWFLTQPQRYKNANLNIRNYCLFVFACNCARRISDILDLNVCDVCDARGNIKKKFIIQEHKTDKYAEVFINAAVREALGQYLELRADGDLQKNISGILTEPLFSSNKGGDKLQRQQAWRIMKTMAREIGLEEKGVNFAPHGCRKTWAYMAIKNNPENARVLATVSQALNHESEATTRRYADITSEDIEELYESLNL